MKIVLLLDNAPSRKILTDFSNVELCYLTANSTGFLQPLDTGIIRSFKPKYKLYLLRRVLEEFASGKSIEEFGKSVNIKNAIIFAKWATDEVSSETVKKSWIETKRINSPIVFDDTSNLDAYNEIQSALCKITSNSEVKAKNYIEKENELLFDGCQYDWDKNLKIADQKNVNVLNLEFNCRDNSKIDITGESSSDEIQVPENK